jgi:hypothetical protein
VAQFKSCSNRDHIPLTLVAHSANALLGTVAGFPRLDPADFRGLDPR